MKYEPLTAYLRESGEERIQLTFAHLDDILSFRLGKSPRNHRAWWANGGHDHASAWMDAGYKVEAVNLTQETVVFVKDGAANTPDKTAAPKAEKIAKLVMQEIPRRTTDDIITLCGYKFSFVQELIPECDGDGRIKEYQPQTDYQKQKPLNAHGSGSFCRFTIHAGNWPGVYLWVADDEIIYIGETAGLARRFNTGYGVIEPVNCHMVYSSRPKLILS